MPPTPDSARVTAPPDVGARAPHLLRRRVRLVRRHLGPGPYLDYGCGRGELLALLATRGSVTGFVPEPALAELARTAAPGCPVHTNPDALPAGVFRGILAVTTTPPAAATLATWRRVLVARRSRAGGRRRPGPAGRLRHPLGRAGRVAARRRRRRAAGGRGRMIGA